MGIYLGLWSFKLTCKKFDIREPRFKQRRVEVFEIFKGVMYIAAVQLS